MTEWSDISTAPKDEGAEYLIWDGYDIWLVNVHRGDWWILTESTVDEATHWMPLPEPPKPEGS